MTVSTGSRVKYRDVVKLLEKDGWLVERTVGSHMQFRHNSKAGTVTLPAGGKLGKDVPVGTLNSIMKQAGLR
jgi:predicted RNA binding protein YcfA (HicA-like mRNA interferase family)